MWVIREQFERVKRHHATHKVMQVTTGRSIWILGLMGGSGEVRQVAHLYCETCKERKPVIVYGTPIQEDELIEVG